MKNLRSFFQSPKIDSIDINLGPTKSKFFVLADFSSEWILNGELTLEAKKILEKFKFYNVEKNLLINEVGSIYLEQISLRSIPYLVYWSFEKNEIRVYSQNAHFEKFLTKIKMEQKLELDSAFINHVAVLSEVDFKKIIPQIDIITQNFQLKYLKEIYQGEIGARLLQKESEYEQKLLIEIKKYRPSFLEWITDIGLYYATEYEALRVHLLKYLAVLPSLDHDISGSEVKTLFLETLRRLLEDNKKNGKKRLPWFINLFFKLVFKIFKLIPDKSAGYIIRTTIRLIAKRFIAGKNIEDAKTIIDTLKKSVRQVTLDQLGELVVAETEADQYLSKVLELINGLKKYINVGERNGAHIYKAHVSIKVSALCAHFNPADFDYSYKFVAPRLKKILLTAKKENVFIQIDAEHYSIRNLVFQIYKKVLLETKELHDYFATGIVIQCYLKDAYEHFLDVLELAKERKLIMPIRLVKGAYFDAETVEASSNSHSSFQFLNKEETDIHFRQIIFETLKNYKYFQLCVASHNLKDHAFSEALKETYFPYALPIEHQCLHMTYEALSVALANYKFAVRNYAPVGDLLTGMGYLVRRILENSSQVGILAQMRLDKIKKINEKIELPQEKAQKKFSENIWQLDEMILNINGDFVNISPVRPFEIDHREIINERLTQFKSDGLNIKFLNEKETKTIIEQSYNEFKDGDWPKLKPFERTLILLNAQNLMLKERSTFATLIIKEAKKSILEAYADVDEAIDFINFYARENYFNKIGVPRGPIAVIAPWNFPLAIPCGMVAAALVTGNSVILKSAEQTPIIAEMLVNLFIKAGVPKNILIHAPGMGESVGVTLVDSSKICGVIFTGSKAVGSKIYAKLSTQFFEHPHLKREIQKRVVTEMGGKNCLIVTKSAELDETISGILKSAFNHAGQKCSALSKIIVHQSIKDKLIQRLKLALHDIEVGSSDKFSTTINPLISQSEVDRIKDTMKSIYEEVQLNGGEIVVDRSKENFENGCVGPSLVYLPQSYVTSIKEGTNSSILTEHFGPILHITEFNTLDEAIQIFNSSEYALTGGVYSQSQDEIDYLANKLMAGNIYINRNITGARVGIEPFGGFKLSGTGPKAGGKEYLDAFKYYENILFKEVKTDVFTKNDGSSQSEIIDFNTENIEWSDKNIDQFNFFIGEISQNFETLFPFWKNELKKDFYKIKIWSFENLKKYLNRKVVTKKIRGQINFNDYTLTKERGLLISTNSEISFNVFLYFLIAVSLGLKLKIVVLNDSSRKFWREILNTLYQNGFKEVQVSIIDSNFELLESMLLKNVLDYLIIDSTPKFIKLIKPNFKSILPLILSSNESVQIESFEKCYELFFNKRTFAINIMRYGAPMENQNSVTFGE